MRTATQAIRDGEIVCIFAEGQISRTGQMLPFRKGFERIMKDVEAPIVPVQLDRLWGSIWSFAEGRFFWKRPRRIPYQITISFGRPLAHDADTIAVRDAIMELGTEAWMARKLEQPLLHRAFIRTVRAHPFAMAFADGRTPKMSYLMAYVGAIALGRKLKKILGPEPMTGILLPQSAGGAVTNIALQIMGKVAVNLNYTASNESVASAANQCGIRHVLTASEFLQRVPIAVPGETVLLDEVKKSITSTDKLIAILLAVFCPMRVVERALGSPKGRAEDDLCTVVFSSGSEGEPKGVMLSHKNVLTNCEAVAQVFPHETGDGFMGILPFFHSFGFMGTLWLPYAGSLPYIIQSLEPKIIGPVDLSLSSALLIDADLPAVVRVVCRRIEQSGARRDRRGKTSAARAPAFLEVWRQPLEIWRQVFARGIHQRARFRARASTKWERTRLDGQALPGVSVNRRPDAEERLPRRGPAAGEGPEHYEELPRSTGEGRGGEGRWYNTGDIAIDERASSLSPTASRASAKSLARCAAQQEETLHRLDMNEQTFAVTACRRTKGERLIVSIRSWTENSKCSSTS